MGEPIRLGLDASRAVQIVVVLPTGAGRRGSGYLVRHDVVLTAAHVVDRAAAVEVRFLDQHGRPRDHSARIAFAHAGLDIAVLRLGGPSGLPDVEPIRYGHLGEVSECEALGFPRFKLRRVEGADGRAAEYRDTRHARGRTAPLSALRERVLEVLVDPPEYDPDPKHSPWEGMSGAAVWSHGRVVGVVSEHRREDGLGTLTATRVDRWHERLTADQARILNELIGLPPQLRQLDQLTTHSDQLDRYLEAVSLAVDSHPYPGVVPGTPPPPLTELYVQQLARLQEDSLPGAGPVPTAAVLSGAQLAAQEQSYVLLGGPGGGKTCLLRAAVAASVSRWQRLRQDGSVPVLVDAADLTGELPFPEAVARAVTAELSRFGLLGRLSPELFQARPRPDVPWLVLVDGLDEIGSPEARRSVLATLANLAKQRGPTIYRFVVASRPLPDWEFAALGKGVPRYELRSFEPGELRQFTERWFDVLGLSAPERAAAAFVTALEQARVADLARIPLMATMLCQLYVEAPEQPLPSGRSEIYARFVEQLVDRHRAAGISGVQAQTRATLERHGSAALAQAQRTLDELVDLIAHLAADRQAGRTDPATDLIASQPAARRPAPVAEAVWSEFLRDVLRRSGLLIERGGDFDFLHRTVQEYLAARRLAAEDARAGAGALGSLLGEWERQARRQPFKVLSYEHDSYCGFLLDATGTANRRILRRLVGRGGLEGREILARLVQLGTAVPAEIVARAADRLVAHVRRDRAFDWGRRIRAATALADLRDDRAPGILLEVAEDTSTIRPARVVGELDDAGFQKVLNLRNRIGRVQAALKLAQQGDRRGLELLLAFVRDSNFDDTARAHAAGALADLRYEHAADILLLLAKDPQVTGGARALAARLLGLKLGDRRGIGPLLALARDPAVDRFSRVQAGIALSRLADARGPSILAALARDRGRGPGRDLVDDWSRVRAARALADLGDKRAVKLLTDLAGDTRLYWFNRRRAKVALAAHLRSPGGIEDHRRLEHESTQLEESLGAARLLVPYFRLQNWVLGPLLLRRSRR